MVVGADALDVADRPRAEPGARPVGDAEIHRHADEGNVEPGEIRSLRRLAAVRRIEQRRDAAIGELAPVSAGEDERNDLLEFRIEYVAPLAFGVFRAQRIQFCLVDHGGLLGKIAQATPHQRFGTEPNKSLLAQRVSASNEDRHGERKAKEQGVACDEHKEGKLTSGSGKK